MYDAIIVGAGPGGSSAAIYSNKFGLKSLLLDKSVFPRDKVCGDALSGKSVKLLDELGFIDDINKLDGAVINRIIFGNPNHSECELDLAKSRHKEHISNGYVIPRFLFDDYLFQKAKQSSDYKDGFTVTDLIFKDNYAIGVIGNDKNGIEREYYANVIMGADGPNSIVSKKAGLYKMDMNHTAIGVRCYYENVGDLTDQIELHYVNEINPGYFWIFPSGGKTANIGVGLQSSIIKQKKKNLFKIMKTIIKSQYFYKRFKNAKPIGKPSRWSLPFGSIKRRNHGNGVLLLGDAAGLVDPFTGEGIGNAMVSGKIAAQTLLSSKSANDYSSKYLSRYDKKLWNFIGSELRVSTKLLKLARSKFLLNFVIDRAARNNNTRNIISGMLANEIPKTELSNPLFYLKILFS